MADGQDWRSPSCRATLIAQIDEAIRSAGTQMHKTSSEMESHVFNKAKSKDEYLALVARLILHLKENKDKRPQQMVVGQVGAIGQGGVVGQVGPMGQVGVMNQMGQVGGMGGHGMGQMNPQMQGRPMQDPINALTNLTRPMQQNPQGMMGGHQMQQQHRPGMFTAAQIRLHQQQQQQQQQQPNKPPLQRQDAFIVTSPQNVNPVQSQPLPASAANLPFQGQPQPPPNMQRQMPGQQIAHSPSQVNVCSPAVFMAPSPQSMVIPSPANRGGVGVPSPGAALNTPGNPGSVGPVPSPGGRQIADEQMYMEKLQKLSKFVGPLRGMVDQLEKDESRKIDYEKMKNLLDILTDPTKRVPYATLEKCEQVLENHHNMSTKTQSTTASMFEPLYEAVSSNIRTSSINHSLHRTFGPGIAAFFGPPIKAPTAPSRKRKVSALEKEEGLSNVLQGEIARLDRRFKISVDPLHHSSNLSVHLICKLEDKNLPSVPPLVVKIPQDYPNSTPECDTDSEGYDATPFFQEIQKFLELSLVKMPNKFSLSALLNSWEMSVRRSCET